MTNSGNAFIDDLDFQGAVSYLELRPSYPPETLSVLDEALAQTRPTSFERTRPTSFESGGSAFRDDSTPNGHPFDSNAVRAAPGTGVKAAPGTAVDIGAGSGQLTRLLAEHGFQTVAVEPSNAMRRTLLAQQWVAQTGTEVVNGVAEDTGLPDDFADLVTWAQCFHWLDASRATEEAARILKPGGVAAAIWNQLDVRRPWVHRLTRIMRSGDVLERQRQPEFGEHFDTPRLTIIQWEDHQTPEQVMELARTRSSYIRAGEPGRAKMQQNLHWYLIDRLGFYPGEPIELPYRTFIWSASRT